MKYMYSSPTIRIGMPTAVSSNIPKGGSPYWVNRPLTTTFVEVPTRVTELARMEANAIGINIFAGWILRRLDKPIVIGVKNAAVAVLEINALKTPAAPVMIQYSWILLLPTVLRIRRDRICTIPVRTRAAVNISNPRIIMDVSLPKPSKAVSAGKMPVRINASMSPSAITSAGKVSIENRTNPAAIMINNKIIERVIK